MKYFLALFYTDGDFIQTYAGDEHQILSIINRRVVYSDAVFESLDELSSYIDNNDFEDASQDLNEDIRFTVATMDGSEYIVW